MANHTNSVLDPVLVETLLTWFAPCDGAKVFDCFAGDPQGGFVSSYLGYEYTGIELREEQCRDNRETAGKYGLSPVYICDDGRNVAEHLEKESQDLLISCPPYFDMEVYSDLPNDASNQGDFDAFYKILDEAFTASIPLLKNNRFACVICTDIRGKDGTYYDFAERIRRTFERNGMGLYNHLIIKNPIGTAAMRANKFMMSRKTVRVHQDILVFLKGTENGIRDEFRSLSFESKDE